MKIINFRGIKEFEYQSARINIFYGQNGIGKTTIKDVLTMSAEGSEIGNHPHIDLASKPTIIEANELRGLKCITFDEAYVKQYVFSEGSLKDANKYGVLFSKNLIEETKNDARKITKLLVDSNGILNKVIGELSISTKIINEHFGTKKIKPKLSNITKQGLDKELDQTLLDFTREPTELHIWWKDGFQNIWDVSRNKCIFCNQEIISSPIVDLLKSKLEVKLNAKTQLEFLKNIDNVKMSLDKNFDSKIQKLKGLVIDSYSKDISTELSEFNDAILPFTQLIEKILSRKTRISNYSNKFGEFNADGLNINDYDNVLNDELTKQLKQYNDNVDLIKGMQEIYSKKLVESKEKLKLMIEGNKELFNDVLKTFNLNYQINIEEDGLDIELEKLDYSFNLMGTDPTNMKDIIDESSSILSFGEKNTIAFAFFLMETINTLKNRKPEDNYVIVLDDPISSHDIFRKYSTVDLVKTHIVDSLEDNDIFFLFTHEFEFMLPIKETLINPIKRAGDGQARIVGLNFGADKIKVFDLTSSHFNNSIARMVKNINCSSNSIISKFAMMRILREIDSTIFKFRFKDDFVYSFLCDFLHYRDSKLTFNEEKFSEFCLRYRLTLNVPKSFKEFKKIYEELPTKDLSDLDKYYVMRPYIEYLLAGEGKELQDYSYLEYSNKNLVEFIDKNFSFLNSTVHQKQNEDEVSFNDIKEFEMFSSKIFNDFLKAISN